jgi:hypothetical protein
VALKRRSSTVLQAVLRLLDYSLVNIKSDVKGNGQECPFHTGKVKARSTSRAAGGGARCTRAGGRRMVCCAVEEGCRGDFEGHS